MCLKPGFSYFDSFIPTLIYICSLCNTTKNELFTYTASRLTNVFIVQSDEKSYDLVKIGDNQSNYSYNKYAEKL